MNKCKSCGLVFADDEIATYEEKHGLDNPPYERWGACPNCGGDFQELHDCEICGETCDEPNERFCNDCKSKVKERFSDFVNNNFTKEERECLNILYEGEEI